MSNKAHSGRCFRATRRTKLRKARKGLTYDAHPIRYKVPLAIMPFLTVTGTKNQRRAQHDAFGIAIARYVEHRRLTGQGAPVRAEGDQVSGAVHKGQPEPELTPVA